MRRKSRTGFGRVLDWRSRNEGKAFAPGCGLEYYGRDGLSEVLGLDRDYLLAIPKSTGSHDPS